MQAVRDCFQALIAIAKISPPQGIGRSVVLWFRGPGYFPNIGFAYKIEIVNQPSQTNGI